MRVFSVSAPDSISLIFTKFIDIRVLSCWKACKNEVKGDVLCVRPCSVNAVVAVYVPFCAVFTHSAQGNICSLYIVV